MEVSTIRNIQNLQGNGPVSLYTLDTELDNMQKVLKQSGDSQVFLQDAEQFFQNSQAWLQEGNNASKFPKFTSWVADAKVNGNNMSANNPFKGLLMPTGESDASTSLQTILATLSQKNTLDS